MKRNLLSLKVALVTLVLSVVLVFNSFGQASYMGGDGSLFLCDPFYMRGYAIINDTLHPGMEKAVITVTASRYVDKGKIVTDTVYIKELKNINYAKLPEEFFYSDTKGTGYNLSIASLDKNENIIRREEHALSLMPPDYDEYNSDYCWPCNGYNYAWQITFNRKIINGQPVNSGYLSLDTYDKGMNSSFTYRVPHYVYVTQDDWNALTNTSDKWRAFRENHRLDHIIGVSSYPPAIDEDLMQGRIKKIGPAEASDGLIGYYGRPVSGSVVYGIQKTRGEWNLCALQTPILDGISTSSNPSRDIMYAIGKMRDYAYGYGENNCPVLECNSWEGSLLTGSTLTGGTDKFFRCIESTDWSKPSKEAFTAFRKCLKSNGTVGKVKLQSLLQKIIWPKPPTDNLKNIQGTLISFDEEYSINEILQAKSIDYPAGLYSVKFILDDETEIYTPIEFPNGIKIDNTISDYIEASLYPNPITSSIFNIEFESQIKEEVKAKYSIYNGNGKFIYAMDILIPNGQITITVDNKDIYFAETKTIIHVIEFMDNSKITINSIKE